MSNKRNSRDDTRLVTSGRHPDEHFGFVNPPVFHASTVLYPDVDALRRRDQKYIYGRRGTPVSDALEEAIADIEGGYKSRVTGSGLAAITTALMAFVKAGDHILVADTVYRPTRNFCDSVLKRFGVETTYYDPLDTSAIGRLSRPNTTVVFTEAPGSQTFEMQDIPAAAKAAHEAGAVVIMDNTWASPLYFKPFEHGVDVSIQAATKYIVGHSDAMLGAITATQEHWEAVIDTHNDLGACAGPDDTYLAQRGIRTLGVRLERHMKNGIALAEWLEKRPEVSRVLHPALASHPGHDIWKRDFLGASGLFSIVLEPCPQQAVDAFLNAVQLFGMGYSWGGYESLVIPFDPRPYRTATTWESEGQGLRIHAGLEDVSDLIADLEQAFDRLHAEAGM